MIRHEAKFLLITSTEPFDRRADDNFEPGIVFEYGKRASSTHFAQRQAEMLDEESARCRNVRYMNIDMVHSHRRSFRVARRNAMP
jgi:hypothetical protein